ncbi:hypothetical protein ONZ45_g7628 [Pleurotus djamor]|nr:hypothetical protein ONZ45_g7628 [Pleurotus djamor]
MAEYDTSTEDIVLEEPLLPAQAGPKQRSHRQRHDARGSRQMLNWGSLIAGLSLLVTGLNLVYLTFSAIRHDQSPSLPLRTVSTYIGLEQAPRNSSSPGWPRTLRHCPDYIGHLDRSEGPNGLSESKLRHVSFDQKHSLILQVVARDLGLESCALDSIFPDKFRSKLQRSDGQEELVVRLLQGTGPSTNFVGSAADLGPFKDIGTLNVSLAKDRTHFWHCRAGTVQRIEISCPTTGCSLAFTQGRTDSQFGFLLFQSEIRTEPLRWDKA